MIAAVLTAALCSAAPGTVTAGSIALESPRNFTLELKLGPYTPLFSRSFPENDPYTQLFGVNPMLMGEVGLEYMIWQRFGTLSGAVTVGYAEKFGKALIAGTTQFADESTGIRLITIRPGISYRFDWAAIRHNVPLVPYVKGSFVAIPWWIEKGQKIETYEGVEARGVAFGLSFTAGLSLMLDFLDQRLARDFDSSVGVNHTYLFAEINLQETFRSSTVPITFSSQYWLFGLAFDL
jgi:hypothetical protein